MVFFEAVHRDDDFNLIPSTLKNLGGGFHLLNQIWFLQLAFVLIPSDVCTLPFYGRYDDHLEDTAGADVSGAAFVFFADVKVELDAVVIVSLQVANPYVIVFYAYVDDE